MEELSDEITHYAAEHPLTDSRNLAADVRFVAILQPSAPGGLWPQAHEARSGSEAQCARCFADEAQRVSFSLVAELDLRLISTANASNADHDLSRVGIRTILSETSASRDNGGKFARIQKTPPDLLHRSRDGYFSSASQHVADGRSNWSGSRDCRTSFGDRGTPVRKSPDAPQGERQRNIVAPKRVGHGVCDSGGGQHGTAVAHPLRTERIVRGERFDVADVDLWNLGGRGTKIIGEG